MALEVVGTGFGRTGTGSLKRALETVGFTPCNHSFGRPWQLPYWRRALAGQAVDWNDVFAGFRAQMDWPGVYFWREILKAFPNAKVIHTIRPEDEWWESFARTTAVVLSRYREMNLRPQAQEFMAIAVEIVGPRTFGSTVNDKEAALAAYRRHNQQVLTTVPAERLLVFEVAQGWEPLCRFLDRPFPAIPFPRVNATDDWWANWPSRPVGASG